jgi:1-acyl-sn-glycerol-3-phosphate acyltransferase
MTSLMTVLRSALFNLYFFGLTFVLTLVGTVVRYVTPGHRLLVPVLWARLVLAGLRIICGIRIEISGREWLPTGGPALIASLHQSAFDTLVWLSLLPRCCYVLKHELLRIPVLGPLIGSTEMIAVDRTAGAASLRHLLREADRAVREARQIVIFPEGTRGTPGHPLPLQPGVAAVAARTDLSVIPVVTDSGRCWGRRAFHKYAGVIHIEVRPPMPSGMPRATLLRELELVFRSEIGQPHGIVDKFVD